MFDIEDIGVVALNTFLNWDSWKGKFVPLAGDHIRFKDLVREFSRVTGKQATARSLPLEEYKNQKFPGAEEMAEMFGWFAEYGYYGTKNPDLAIGRKLNPKMKSWADWLNTSTFVQTTSQ
jgi:hypothetical protein